MCMCINGLTASYGKNRVLDDISLMIGDGDVVSVLGPNGVGKTTLIKSICRIRDPDAGEVSLNGRDVRDYRPREFARQLSYVPQRAFTSTMTVFDSVLIGRRPHIDWTVTAHDEDITWDVLKLFSMEHLALKHVDEISGGELQKVQIARAVVQNAGTMVFDEPTNNLDLANQHAILGIIRHIVKVNRSCAIMIMHDVNTAACYSDKFIFMKGGRVQAYGGAETLTPDVIEAVYGVKSEVRQVGGTPVVIPQVRDWEDVTLPEGMRDRMRCDAL